MIIKQLLEIMAKTPDVSEVGLAYIDYLHTALYFKCGLIGLFFILIGFCVYFLIKSGD